MVAGAVNGQQPSVVIEHRRGRLDGGVIDGSTVRVLPQTAAGGVEKHERPKEGKTFSLYGQQAFDRLEKAVDINLDNLQQNIIQARRESNQFFKLTLVFSGLGLPRFSGQVSTAVK